jgi:hypothetical protein
LWNGLGVLLVVLAWVAVAADDYPPPIPERKGPPPPPLEFRVVEEVPLPGPLPAVPLSVDGETIVVHVAGGVTRVRPGSEERPQIAHAPPLAQPAPAETSGWVIAPDGGFRYQSSRDGWIRAERRCDPCRRGWRRAWNLRVGAGVPSEPVLDNGRVYFSALDNRVHAVRADRGHLLWATDVGDRVTHAPLLWKGTVRVPPATPGGEEQERELALLIIVPAGGGSVVAVDAWDGARLATLSVGPAEGPFAGPPVLTPEGWIVVARQKYAEEKASLVVLLLARRGA